MSAAVLLQHSGEPFLAPSPPLAAPQRSLALPAWQLHSSHLCLHRPLAFSLCAPVRTGCVNPRRIGFGPPSSSKTPSYQMTSATTLFPNKVATTGNQIEGVKTLLGDTLQPLTEQNKGLKVLCRLVQIRICNAESLNYPGTNL